MQPGELCAVGIPGDAEHPVAVTGDRELLAAAGHIEDPHDAIGGGGREPIAGGTERTIEHHVARHSQHFGELAAVGLKQSHFAVLAGSAAGNGQELTIGAEVNGVSPLTDAADAADQLAVGRVPNGDFVIATDEKLRTIGTEFDRGNRHRATIGFGRGRMCRRRNVRRQGSLGIGTIKRHAGFDPPLEKCHLLGGQWIAFQRHSLLRIRRGDSAKRLASLQVLAHKAWLRRITRRSEPLEGVDAIAGFSFFRPVTGEAIVEQQRRDVALEAEWLGRRNVVRV